MIAHRIAVVAAVIAQLATVGGCKKKRWIEADCGASIGVRLSYPGASPGEVEQGVLLAVEEAVRSLTGVASVHTLAREGGGLAEIGLVARANPDVMVERVREAIDRISTFPEALERPTVHEVRERDKLVLAVVPIGFERERLEAIPGVGAVFGFSRIGYEISIEVDRYRLRSYGIPFDRIAAAVRAARIAPQVDGVLIRANERRARGSELREIVIRPRAADGAEVKLADIATIRRRPVDTPAAYYRDQRVEVFALDSGKGVDRGALASAGVLATTARLGFTSCPRAWGRQLGATVAMAQSTDASEVARSVAELDALVLAGSDIFDLGSDGVEVIALTDQTAEGLDRLPGLDVIRSGDAVFVELTGSGVERASRDLAARLRRSDNIIGVLEQPPPATSPAVDFRLSDAGRSAGLTAASIAQAVRRATKGEVAAVYAEGAATVSVLVRFAGASSDPKNLGALPIEIGGESVPLTSVAAISLGQAPVAIYRRDGRRRTHLQVLTRGDGVEAVRAAVKELPPQISAEVFGPR